MKKINDLIAGYKRFRDSYFGKDPEKTALFEKLSTQGQNPKFLVIACSDSRVDPAIILDCAPGDLFVVRNVANLVPPCEHDDSGYHGTSAALEYAVEVLQIHHIILLGHKQCGGIRALMEHHAAFNPHSFIGHWIEIADSARNATLKNHPDLPFDEQIEHCSHYSLTHSLENLRTFPWVQKRVAEQTLFLHAWYFDIGTGLLEAYQENSGLFKELDFN